MKTLRDALTRTSSAILIATACSSAVATSKYIHSTVTNEDAAYCAAVLKQEVQAQAANGGSRDHLVSLTKAGYAFVGTVIKSGVSRQAGDALLDEAEAKIRSSGGRINPRTLKTCEDIAGELLKGATGLERSLVSYKAKKRVDDLLGSQPR